jgi:hypothetical protein
MGKHKLSLDSLQVETFDTVAGARPPKGTVYGNDYTDTIWCATCGQTCNAFDQVCTFNQAYTCGCPTNAGCFTDAVSCQGTCDPCTDGYTCVNTCGAHTCICSAFCNTIDVCETAPETGCL